MSDLIDTFCNRLKTAMRIRNIKAVELSNLTGIAKSSLSDYINGKYEAKQDGVFLLAKALNVNEAWLMGADVSMERNMDKMVLESIEAVSIPILGKISAGLPLMAEENKEGSAFAPANLIKPGYNYFYLRVVGDSMNLKFNEGDIILVQKQDSLENGDIGVIRVNGFDATIKKYRFENNLVLLEPMSTNIEHKTQIYNPKEIEIAIIGKAISYQGNI